MLTSETTPLELAILLNTSEKNLNYLAYVANQSKLYTSFVIKKKNGSNRIISSPNHGLKNIQRKISSLLEKIYKPHPSASAFINNRGIVYNAKKHTRKKYVFNIDLSDFYNQIHFGRVYGLLTSKPYSLNQDTARLISNLCCYNEVIPQGAPTSPVISNMICYTLDVELSLLAKKNCAYYTRYADDITFSFAHSRINGIVDIHLGMPSQSLNNIIMKNGFNINTNKTRLSRKNERQIVTGLKVNKKVNIDRRYIRTTRAMIFSLASDPVIAKMKFKQKFDSGSLEKMIAGRINFIGQVKGKDSSVFHILAEKFNAINTSIKIKTPGQSASPSILPMHINKDALENSIWVVSFEGIKKLNLDEELVIGTAFVVDSGKIITTNHTFDKANSKHCFLYRIKNPSIKYPAHITKSCNVSDIAELEFDTPPKDLASLKIANNHDIHHGYQLVLAGFPQLQTGHNSVSLIPCSVINTYKKSTFNHIEINADIYAGNSGGPLLNAYMQVVGMAIQGRSVATEDNKNFFLEGNNACISAAHL